MHGLKASNTRLFIIALLSLIKKGYHLAALNIKPTRKSGKIIYSLYFNGKHTAKILILKLLNLILSMTTVNTNGRLTIETGFDIEELSHLQNAILSTCKLAVTSRAFDIERDGNAVAYLLDLVGFLLMVDTHKTTP